MQHIFRVLLRYTTDMDKWLVLTHTEPSPSTVVCLCLDLCDRSNYIQHEKEQMLYCIICTGRIQRKSTGSPLEADEFGDVWIQVL